MNLSEEMIERFQNFLNHQTPEDPQFILTRMSSETRCMVYGCNSPQVTVLGLCAMVDAAIKHEMVPTLFAAPPVIVKLMAEEFISGAQSNKSTLQQASNFWLSKLAGYSQQTTKAITGSVEGADAYEIEKAKTFEEKNEQQRYDKRMRAAPGKAMSTLRKLERTPEKGDFYKHMRASAFDISDLVKAGPAVFDAKGAKGREQTTSDKDMKLSDLIYDSSVRRACKFLIYEAVQNGQQVVYLLDDLDLNKLAYLVTDGGKIPDDARLYKGDANGKVPICTTELREIFRCWDYLRRHVTFYEGLMETTPPWAPARGKQDFWARYAAHRADKLLKTVGDGLAPADAKALGLAIDAAASGLHQQAITQYHAGNPSRYGRGASLHVVTKEPEF